MSPPDYTYNKITNQNSYENMKQQKYYLCIEKINYYPLNSWKDPTIYKQKTFNK